MWRILNNFALVKKGNFNTIHSHGPKHTIKERS